MVTHASLKRHLFIGLTNCVKIAFHAPFVEGMNDLAFESLPPNVKHLQRTDEDQAGENGCKISKNKPIDSNKAPCVCTDT